MPFPSIRKACCRPTKSILIYEKVYCITTMIFFTHEKLSILPIDSQHLASLLYGKIAFYELSARMMCGRLVWRRQVFEAVSFLLRSHHSCMCSARQCISNSKFAFERVASCKDFNIALVIVSRLAFQPVSSKHRRKASRLYVRSENCMRSNCGITN